jgi:WRKY DNA -binding domain
MPKWRNQVTVNTNCGVVGPLEDGYSWRKYGQKDILGAKYPR